MHRDAPLAELRRVGHGPRIGFGNPARRSLIEVEQALERIARNNLHAGIGTHRGGFEDLGYNAARQVGINNVTAIGIGTDRKRLDLIARKRALLLPHVRVEGRLVRGKIGCTELANVGATRPCNAARPSKGLGVEVNLIAIGRHHARLALGSKNGVIGLLLRDIKIGFDLGELLGEQRVGGALLFDLGQTLVVHGLELGKGLVQILNSANGLLDFVRHG